MRFGKIDVRYLGAVLALAFSLLIIVSVGLRQGADWWSAWGQRVGGAGSIGAAGVAVWIAVEGWRRSDLDAKNMRERELASKVALWIEQTEAQRTIQSSEQLVRTSARFVLKYINGGGMPIYRAEATVTFPNGPAPYIDTQLMLRPTTTPEDFERTPETFHQILLESNAWNLWMGREGAYLPGDRLKVPSKADVGASAGKVRPDAQRSP